MYNLHGALEQALFCCLYVEGNDHSGHVSFPPTDPPVRVHLSHPDAWSPVSAAPGLDPTCSSLSAPHSVCQDPWIPRPFMLGLWANTFPLEVHFSAGRHHPRPWVPGLPILLLTCLMSSIPTDVPCFSGPLGACIHLARGAGAQGAAPPSPCPPSEAPHTLAAQKPPVTGSFPRGKGEFTLFR